LSLVVMPKSMDVRNRVKPWAATAPMMSPVSVSFAASTSTWLSTVVFGAPSAIRTPISRVRSATAYAMTP